MTFIRDGRLYICAWHADFDRSDPKNAGASHGMCDGCAEKFERQSAELRSAKEEK